MKIDFKKIISIKNKKDLSIFLFTKSFIKKLTISKFICFVNILDWKFENLMLLLLIHYIKHSFKLFILYFLSYFLKIDISWKNWLITLSIGSLIIVILCLLSILLILPAIQDLCKGISITDS